MPPASSNTSGAAEKERLHRKFSAAATALADLYRESSDAYEAGYRDALFFVQRYLQSSSPAASQALLNSATTSSTTAAVGLCSTVSAAQMTRFLQDTVAARRERVAVVRGACSLRRRQRETAADTPAQMHDVLSTSDAEDEVTMAEETDEDGEETGLTTQPSPVMRPDPFTVAIGAPAVVEGADTTLTQEIELITHLEPRVVVRETPLQPQRQRPRTERTHGAQMRYPHSSRGSPCPPQLHVARGK